MEDCCLVPPRNYSYAVHVVKIRDLLLMGGFLGSEDMRSREMATHMPDWYALIVLDKDRLNLTKPFLED